MSSEIEQFNLERCKRINDSIEDIDFSRISTEWLEQAMEKSYAYNFDWLGRPIIQLPQDIVAIQELIWRIKPDLIIETGIAHGGSLILSASILALIELSKASTNGTLVDPKSPDSIVLGIDIDIRPHNRELIERHPLGGRVQMIEGSSTDLTVLAKVNQIARDKNKVMIFLDSNHTHSHVLEELKLYSSLVSPGSYLVVFDTFVEKMSTDIFPNRPWSKGNNPYTATQEFLVDNQEFEVDHGLSAKLGISVAPAGFLRKKED
jgi:cephalosporin hydroxylase